MSGLDPDINLCRDLMSGSHVGISCRDLMSGSDVHFSVGFPVFAVKYFSKLKFCIHRAEFQILRNTEQQKQEIELKRAVINTD